MKDVIELAKQAGIPTYKGMNGAEYLHVEGVEVTDEIKALIKLVRNAALEEAAQYCHEASIPQPDQIRADAQWAAACLAVNLRNLKEPTP